jgi:hypothetical protein
MDWKNDGAVPIADLITNIDPELDGEEGRVEEEILEHIKAKTGNPDASPWDLGLGRYVQVVKRNT